MEETRGSSYTSVPSAGRPQLAQTLRRPTVAIGSLAAMLHHHLDGNFHRTVLRRVVPPVIGGHVEAVHEDRPANLLLVVGVLGHAQHALLAKAVAAAHAEHPRAHLLAGAAAHVVLNAAWPLPAPEHAWSRRSKAPGGAPPVGRAFAMCRGRKEEGGGRKEDGGG